MAQGIVFQIASAAVLCIPQEVGTGPNNNNSCCADLAMNTVPSLHGRQTVQAAGTVVMLSASS